MGRAPLFFFRVLYVVLSLYWGGVPISTFLEYSLHFYFCNTRFYLFTEGPGSCKSFVCLHLLFSPFAHSIFERLHVAHPLFWCNGLVCPCQSILPHVRVVTPTRWVSQLPHAVRLRDRGPICPKTNKFGNGFVPPVHAWEGILPVTECTINLFLNITSAISKGQ